MGGFDGSLEKSKTTKADLQKALADSFAYCDKVYTNMTDATATTIIKTGLQRPTWVTLLAHARSFV